MPVRLGRYLLEDKIGQGGMAEVYAALLEGPQGFSRRCVVKKLRPELLQSPDQVSFFLEEARLGALLAHPCIVQVFDLGEADGQPFIAMELIDGPSVAVLLDTLERRGSEPMAQEVAATICARAAEGLHFAHELAERSTGRPLHVVHRDVSPQNILLSKNGDVKVADFGIAKIDVDHRPKTRVGMTKGKLAYMSPEQARGERVDRRTDVYALGIVLWEMLTGKPLFFDPALRRTMREHVPSPSVMRPDIDEALERFVLQMLAVEAKDRPPTALAVEDALDTWLAPRGGPARSAVAKLVERALRPGVQLSVSADAPTRVRPSVAAVAPVVDPRARPPRAGDPFDDVTEPTLRAPAAGDPRRAPGASVGRDVQVQGGRAAVMLAETEAPARRLPQPTTRFLGRADETHALHRLLDDGARLITLVGPAGVGKTRLAVRFADLDDVRAAMPGGVWLCELGEETEAAGALDALARTLGVAQRPGPDQAARLRVVVRALVAMGRCLVVLDGADAIAEGADDPASLLRGLTKGAPRVRFMATARRAFGINGEQVLEVPPLPLPALHSDTGSEARVDDDGALGLFLDRARLARGGHALPEASHVVVSEIVRRLDGVPLAIELAAAHAAQQTPHQILDRLATSSSSSVLRAAIESSVKMLDSTEARAFAQASVFCGPFDAVAAESVLDVMDSPDADAELADRLLERLRARSLLQRRSGNTTRFVLLAPLRAHASQLLDELGQRAATEARHAGFYTALGKSLRSRAEHGDADALAELSDEADNLAAVVERIARRFSVSPVHAGSAGGAPMHAAIATGSVSVSRPSPAQAGIALEAALALEPLLSSRTSAADLQVLDTAVRLASGVVDEPLLLRGLLARGEARRLGGEHDAAVEDLGVVYEMATRLDDARARGRCHLSMAQVQLARGRSDEARLLLERAVVECERVKDDGIRARALALLGKVCRLDGDVSTAERFGKDAVDAALLANDTRAAGRARVELASAFISFAGRNRHDEAAHELDLAVSALEACGDLRGLVQAHLTRAVVEVDRKKTSVDEAEAAATRAHALAVRVGDRRAEGAALGWRGCARHLRGALVDAREDYLAAVAVLDESKDGSAAFFSAAAGAAHAALGDVDDATRAIAGARKRSRGNARTTAAVDVLEAVVACFAMNARAQLEEAIKRAPESSEETRFATRVARAAIT